MESTILHCHVSHVSTIAQNTPLAREGLLNFYLLMARIGWGKTMGVQYWIYFECC